jgi:hypothetical protein
MASKDPKISEQGTAGKEKHVTFTPQKPEITGMEWNISLISYMTPYRSTDKT